MRVVLILFTMPKGGQLGHSFSGYNNLVPFHLCIRETALRREKVYKCFLQDCGIS